MRIDDSAVLRLREKEEVVTFGGLNQATIAIVYEYNLSNCLATYRIVALE